MRGQREPAAIAGDPYKLALQLVFLYLCEALVQTHNAIVRPTPADDPAN
jgi:hypothetical protein